MSPTSTCRRRLRSRAILPAVATLPVLATLAAAVVTAGAAPSRAQDRTASIPPIPVDTFRLSNGLRLVVSEDHSTPVVAVDLWYHVGSAHEGEGQRGFSRLFELLPFQATESLEVGAVDRLVARAGGLHDAATGPDRTAFIEVLPSNRVELALWLHAERMGRLRITERVLDAQRRVLEEERRLRREGRPYGSAELTLDTLSQDYGPYRRAALGLTDDLDAADPADVTAFHERYHVPANAVLTVVGDVDADPVRAMAESLFGDIDGGHPAPDLPEAPLPPSRDGERRAFVEDEGARLPLVWVAFGVPPADHPDRHALELLTSLLEDGPSSRLRRRLVDGEGAALELTALLDLRVGPGTLRIGAVASRGVGIGRVESLLLEEITAVRREGVTPRELAGAVNRRRSELVGQLLTVRGRASALQWHVLHQGSPHALNREMARYEEVTVADVRRVARTYLVPENRTVVVARPASTEGRRGR